MAIAMRLRNQLQSVYKLDPLRNEVSRRAVRARPRRAGDSGEAEVGQRPVKRSRLWDIVVSAALMERRERSRSAAIGAPPPCEHACSLGGSTRVVLPRQRSGARQILPTRRYFASSPPVPLPLTRRV